MARRKSPTFTEVELEFMQIIWEKGEVSTENLQAALKDQGRDLSDGSIRKILTILLAKGHLNRRRESRSFYYQPKIDKKNASVMMVADLLKRAFFGSATQLFTALLETKSVTDKDIAEIKKLIDSHKK